MRRGYLLIEALAALAVLGIGLLPLAALAPLALGTVRHYEALGHATRAGAELAELEAPGQVLALQQARADAGRLHLRLCDSLASAAGEDGAPACVGGPRLAVAGPLPAWPGRAGDAGGSAALRTIALWIRP
ncbi:hypothetical protein ACKI2N_014450 [Cupriavidus sp. 30B13]|uniref:hypothetical protein n=1 Tax=Cupriavidus sp. 30B13 TaxID=3384241 RepID=UPI003B8EC2B3